MKPHYFLIFAILVLVYSFAKKINNDGALGNFRIKKEFVELPEKVEGIARIIDGDSFIIGTKEVRLLGIDAPEYKQECDVNGEKVKCGKVSKEKLQEFVSYDKVTCIPQSYDKYGRLLSDCTVNGQDLAKWMLQNGYAKEYVDPATLKNNTEPQEKSITDQL